MAGNQAYIKRLFKESALSITLFALFFLFWGGQAIAGHIHNNEELRSHSQATVSFIEYLGSGGFIEATFENWESEFLQMGALVVLTIFLKQRGSADSKKLHGKEEVDTTSRYSIINASSWRTRQTAIAHTLYRNSLSIALFAIFLASFLLHGAGGTAAHNTEALAHGEEQLSIVNYMRTSQFWFESFQNWQSEFLAVGSLLVLSIFLRQQGSPESKPVGESNAKTGS
ncbi:MAG TPA: DUF6766 family protein [Candidatus Saccharimonadales bacterium]|nr:DUF6766 family protein [Candidatus Saccharimonadales bacterium]